MSVAQSVRQLGTELVHGWRLLFRRPPYRLETLDYDEYWNNRPPSNQQPRYEIMASMLEEGARVLDVGCGDGGFLRYLDRYKPNIEARGIDVSRVAVEGAKGRGVRAEVKSLGSVARTGDQYDHIILSEVIEHVPESERYLRLAWRVARYSVILSFPNIAYWPHRLRLLSGRFPVQWVQHPGEHLRYWSIPDFVDWAQNLALKDADDIDSIKWTPSNGISLLYLYRLVPNLFGNQIVVCISKGV